MKKLFALILALALMLSAMPVFATETQVTEINWSDVEVLADMVEGEFVTLENIGLKLWIPADFKPMELTEEQAGVGMLAIYATEGDTAAVSVQYVESNGLTMDEFINQMMENGGAEPEQVLINGLEGVGYDLPAENTSCAVFQTESGNFVQVMVAPVTADTDSTVLMMIISSIQAAE